MDGRLLTSAVGTRSTLTKQSGSGDKGKRARRPMALQAQPMAVFLSTANVHSKMAKRSPTN